MMTYKYKEIKEKTYKALDFLPIRNYLEKDKEVYEIKTNIEEDLENHPELFSPEFWSYMQENHDFFKDDIFNWMDDAEFIAYCKKRFPDIHWYSEYIERHWVR